MSLGAASAVLPASGQFWSELVNFTVHNTSSKKEKFTTEGHKYILKYVHTVSGKSHCQYCCVKWSVVSNIVITYSPPPVTCDDVREVGHGDGDLDGLPQGVSVPLLGVTHTLPRILRHARLLREKELLHHPVLKIFSFKKARP